MAYNVDMGLSFLNIPSVVSHYMGDIFSTTGNLAGYVFGDPITYVPIGGVIGSGLGKTGAFTSNFLNKFETYQVVKEFTIQSMRGLKKPFKVLNSKNVIFDPKLPSLSPALMPVSSLSEKRALSVIKSPQSELTYKPSPIKFEKVNWTETFDFGTLFHEGTQGSRQILRTNMVKKYPDARNIEGWQAHHAIPWELKENEMLVRLKMNLNNYQNGVILPIKEGGNFTKHFGSHDGYNAAFKGFLKKVESLNIGDTQKKNLVAIGIEKARQNLISGKFGLQGDQKILQQKWEKIFNEFI